MIYQTYEVFIHIDPADLIMLPLGMKLPIKVKFFCCEEDIPVGHAVTVLSLFALCI